MMGPSVERGLWLQELARHAGFRTRAELALALGTSRQTISDWFAGGSIKKLHHQAAICKLFNVTVGTLMDGPYLTVNAPGGTLAPSGKVRGQVYNRRGSGWTRTTLMSLLGALIPAFEEVLQRRGEDEVIRVMLLSLAEMGASPRTMKEVNDAMRKALYELEDTRQAPQSLLESVRETERWAYRAHRAEQDGLPPPPFPDSGIEPYEPDPKRPKDWHTGWLSPRQQDREK